MKGINKKTVWQTAVFIFFIVVVGMSMCSQQKEISLLRKKTEINAKDIEALKIDLNTRKESGTHGSDEPTRNNTDLLFLQRKMAEMKKEIEKFRKSNDSQALNEYREKEEKLWNDRTENTKMQWSENLKGRLVEQGFSEEEIDAVLDNYVDMLDKMKGSVLSWYREEISNDEINKVSTLCAKDFYESASSSIGEQKASIVLAIIFPDHAFRKTLFDVE